ncbi:MAG: hypothetical protein IT233_07345, partial [Bacteroidia bacterium]|nr:hypothetical protein [Bacteroidia bacterium]
MLKYSFFIAFSILSVCHAQSPRFQHLYGNTQIEWIHNVDTLANGMLLAGGYTKSYGQGDYDGFMLRTDSFGNVLGLVTLGGAMEDAVFDFATLPSNRNLVAGFSKSVGINTPVSNAVVCLIEDNGTVLWQKAVGGNNPDGLNSIIRPTQGKYFYASGFTASQGLGGEDGWIIKGDTLGNILWQVTLGTPNNERCQKLVETADGNLAAIVNMDTGSYSNFGLVKLDTSGNILWQKMFGGALNDWAVSLIATADSGFAIAAGGYSYGAGSQDVYLIKLNASGQTQWFRTYGDTYDDNVRDLVEYTDDQGVPRNYFVTGYSPGLESDTSASWGNCKGFVLCTDASGIMQWVNMYGQGPSDYFLTMQLLGNNDLLLAGSGTGSTW